MLHNSYNTVKHEVKAALLPGTVSRYQVSSFIPKGEYLGEYYFKNGLYVAEWPKSIKQIHSFLCHLLGIYLLLTYFQHLILFKRSILSVNKCEYIGEYFISEHIGGYFSE